MHTRKIIKYKILKRILSGLLIIFILGCLLMVTPRLLSVINPEKPPVGYHFEALDYLAVMVGLEALVDLIPEVPEDIEEIKNIEYKNIDGKSLQLDIYRPVNIKRPAPLLVFIHGGSWKGGKRSDYLVYLVDFAKKGYMTATVSYRFVKDSLYPACVEDITDAVKWFYNNAQNYGYDPDRIALIGGSAGAHLSLLAAYELKKPQSNADSTIVPVSQSDQLKARLDMLGVPCVYYRLPGWPHTMDIVQRVNDFCQLKMTDFFDQYLK